jgi:hypothetical protein
MWLCCRKKEKIKPIKQNKLTMKDSNGQLIFEELKNIKFIVQNSNNKIEGTCVNSIHNI